MYNEIIVLGVLLSLLFAELTGVSPAGLVVAGYIALSLQTPLRIAYTLLIVLLTWGAFKLLSRYMLLFGRAAVRRDDPGLLCPGPAAGPAPPLRSRDHRLPGAGDHGQPICAPGAGQDPIGPDGGGGLFGPAHVSGRGSGILGGGHVSNAGITKSKPVCWGFVQPWPYWRLAQLPLLAVQRPPPIIRCSWKPQAGCRLAWTQSRAIRRSGTSP